MRDPRPLYLAIVFVASLLLVVVRLGQLQLVEHSYWQEEARKSRVHKRSLPFHRGRILDAGGTTLALDRRSYDLMFQYRSFRRGHLAGQLLEVFNLLGHAPGGLDDCYLKAEELAENVLSWYPEQLRSLGSYGRSDLLFYLRRLFRVRDSTVLRLWLDEGQAPFGSAFPQASLRFQERLQQTRRSLERLENLLNKHEFLGDEIGQAYGRDAPPGMSFLAKLELERQGLERLIRIRALRTAAGKPFDLTAFEVVEIVQEESNEDLDVLQLAQRREKFLNDLARYWSLQVHPEALEELARRLVGRMESVVGLNYAERREQLALQMREQGVLLRHLERIVPQDLRGSRRRLVREVHQNRVVRLWKNLPFDLVDLLTQNPDDYPGLYTEENPIRDYPDSTAPHLVGMVRTANETDLLEYQKMTDAYGELKRLLVRSPQQEKRLAELRDRLWRQVLRPGETRGRFGLEFAFEDQLRGQRGYLETLEHGDDSLAPRELDFTPPRHGKDLHLALDAELQTAGEQAIRVGYREAQRQAIQRPDLTAETIRFLNEPRCGFVLMDLQNGAVPVMATLPTYTVDDYRRRYEDISQPGGALRQRGLGGGFLGVQAPYPGSTFKLVVAAAALEQNRNYWDKEYECLGYYQPPGAIRGLECDRKWGHGDLNMHMAIVHSCNVYFYKLGEELGYELMYQKARELGFGAATGLELTLADPLDSTSPLGGPNAFLERGANLLQDPERVFGSMAPLHMAIGQVYVHSSPLQLARFFGWIGSGRLWTPRLVHKIGEQPILPRYESPSLALEHRNLLRLACRNVVDMKDRGTAYDENFPLHHYGVAAKTGTAQVGNFSSEKRSQVHAWLAGYFPEQEPRYAFAILCENAGLHGGEISNIILYQFLESPLVQELLDISPLAQELPDGEQE